MQSKHLVTERTDLAGKMLARWQILAVAVVVGADYGLLNQNFPQSKEEYAEALFGTLMQIDSKCYIDSCLEMEFIWCISCGVL